MKILQRTKILDNVEAIYFCENTSKVTASISSKDIARSMVRVKSSNVWSYTINVRDVKKDIGDVYVQFKGEHGGPGDVYVYYDVPTRIYRKIVSSSSKGHAVHQYLRDNFKYSKLTGDRRGKLKNAVNNI